MTKIHTRGRAGEEVMESSKKTTEARRANIIYFLNREGRIEHPHLVRVRHLCHSGVHLSDVKRWLSELRGNEMPDSFAWSYQRRYKKGLVWQDLKDDDLLTPISDCEYVLLGSLLPCAESKSDIFPSPEVKFSPENEQLDAEDDVFLGEEEEEVEQRRTSQAGDAGGRSYPRKPSRLLRKFLTCKAVDTADSTLFAGGGGGVYVDLTKPAGSTRSPLRLQNSPVDNNKRESKLLGGGKSSRKAGRARVPLPKCSQCGNPFNPEKLHSHMKSCKVFKPLGK